MYIKRPFWESLQNITVHVYEKNGDILSTHVEFPHSQLVISVIINIVIINTLLQESFPSFILFSSYPPLILSILIIIFTSSNNDRIDTVGRSLLKWKKGASY